MRTMGRIKGESYFSSSSSALAYDEVTRGEAFGEQSRRPGRGGRALRRACPDRAEAGEACRGAQLERARALLAGDGEGAVIAGGGFVGGAAGREEQVAVGGDGGRHRHKGWPVCAATAKPVATVPWASVSWPAACCASVDTLSENRTDQKLYESGGRTASTCGQDERGSL